MGWAVNQKNCIITLSAASVENKTEQKPSYTAKLGIQQIERKFQFELKKYNKGSFDTFYKNSVKHASDIKIRNKAIKYNIKIDDCAEKLRLSK